MKRQHVRLLQRAPPDHRLDFVPPAFLIVHYVVLDVPDDMLRLFALDAIAHQGSRENRIFSQVFERPSVAWLSRNIRSPAQSHVVTLRAQFPPDQRAIFACRFRIPARRGSNWRWQRRRISPVVRAAAHSISSVADLNNRNSQPLHTEHKSSAAIA